MWIVKLALRQPYTFIVMALLILILGVVAIYRTPVEIFPVVDIPVVSAIWTFTGMAPQDMADQITAVSERAFHPDAARNLDSYGFYTSLQPQLFPSPAV